MLRNNWKFLLGTFLYQLLWIFTEPYQQTHQKLALPTEETISFRDGGIVFVNVYETGKLICPFRPGDFLQEWSNKNLVATCSHVEYKENPAFQVVNVTCHKLESTLIVSVLTAKPPLVFFCLTRRRKNLRFMIQPLYNGVGNLFLYDHRDTLPAGSTLRLICELGESTTLIWYHGDGAVLASYIYCVDSNYDHTKFPGRIYITCNSELHKSSLTIHPVKPSDGRFSIVCKTDEHASMINITVFRSVDFVDIDIGDMEAVVNKVTIVVCPFEKGDELKYWKMNQTLVSCRNTSTKSNSKYYISQVKCNNQFSQISIKLLTKINKLTLYCVSKKNKLMKITLIPKQDESNANIIIIAVSSVGLCLLVFFIAIIAILKFTDGLCFKKLQICDDYLNKD
ncbi:uncharacterized protein LOC106876419 [Octopus bimaculoides]|uniref:Ig-like domain-containing protein n=1 Tax=Octopus bimaculoides TaxID=37653 RepID=A0A0L8GJJ4_OCTBM|nr:uncharacterized protein LOC106876419 [Octopus bimaculoides]|eukprot:XP_014780449.1 PREDICTED: uncharacterized protein LOC106876419 [Octopus bimaculoides]